MKSEIFFITHCPLCASSNIHQLFTIDRFEKPFDIWQCDACFFRFRNPLPSAREEAGYYTEGYYEGTADYSYTDERKTEKYNSYVWKARLKTIGKYVKTGSLLDIGCSFGGFINFASAYYNCSGVESSPYACNFALSRGLRVEQARAEEINTQREAVDVITMIEVIEHTRDPLTVLKKCAAMLRSGGLLVIQTADLHSWQAINAAANYHYYLPGHLSYFTESSLSSALMFSGFSRIKVFRPVDFGLLAKLQKMRGSFTNVRDYTKFFKTSIYHINSYFKRKGIPKTASMVIYAFKN